MSLSRRGFLTGALAAVVAVVAGPLGKVTAAPIVVPPAVPAMGTGIGVWEGIRFVEKEFDYGNLLGVCLELVHSKTGELRRNAVRVQMPCYDLHETGATGEARRAAASERAKALLRQWHAELNTESGSIWGPGVSEADRMEGNEIDSRDVEWADGPRWKRAA